MALFTRILSVAGLVSIAQAAVSHNAIAGVSWGAQRLDIFGADSKNDIFHKYYTAFGWGPNDPAHGDLELFTKADASAPPSVTSWGGNRLDFVFVGSDGIARHKYWDGSSWGPNGVDGFDKLGAGVSGQLAISSWGENRFDVVALSENKTYVHKAWTGSSYYPPGYGWLDLGGEFASPPATVSWGSGRLDIFGITVKGTVAHKYWDGYNWRPDVAKWEDFGGDSFVGAPVASSPHANRFDVWTVSGKTGELMHLFWDGYALRGWESLGGNFSDAPQVAHWAPGRIDILGKKAGKYGSYDYKYWDGHQWSLWENKGGEFRSQPALVNIGENNLNLFGVDKEGNLKLQVWDGSQWLPSYNGWYQLGNTKIPDKESVDRKPTSGTKEKVLTDRVEETNVRIELKFRA